jgi:FAD:protein FMN transferase
MEEFTATKQLLGTEVRVVIRAKENSGEAFDAAFKECERIERAFSRFIEGNELAVLNESCGQWLEVSVEMLDLLKWGVEFGEKSLGTFNVAVSSVLNAWGYNKNYSFKESGKGEVGKVEIEGTRVRISAPVDLGGLGKGYAIDQMCKILRGFCEEFFINAGGDIWCEGEWKVFLEDPSDVSKAIGMVEVSGMALASSSGNKRSWGSKHHLVNVTDLVPASEMLAVYVQGSTAIETDAYSTALFVMGFEKARGIVGDLPVEAMLVAPEGTIWRSEGFMGELFMG